MPSLLDALADKTAILIAPIAGELPSGQDVTFDGDFEFVKTELDKLQSISGGSPNWADIVSRSESVLGSRSKDFRLATWLTVARMHTGGWDGLAEGLFVYRAFIKDYWESAYPDVKRARARANLFSWLCDQVAANFGDPNATVALSEGDAIRACDALFADIDSMLAEKLGESHSGLGKLRGILRDRIRAIPDAEPQADVSKAPETTAQAGISVPIASSVDDVSFTLRACSDAIVSLAKLLRSADPTNVRAYRLNRVGAWLTVHQLPPVEGTLTRIPPPAEDIVKKIAGFMGSEKWSEVLALAEDTSGKYLFWFDCHRFAATALENLGPNYAGARELVGREIVAFVDRFPECTRFRFADGTPFADGTTASWLDDERKRWAPSDASLVKGRISDEDDALALRFEDVKAMILSGKMEEALGLGAELAVRGHDARSRFRAKLNLARWSLDAGRADIARSMLEALYREAESHQLEDWEPALCAQLYAALWLSIRRTQVGQVEETRARELFDKLCKVDPATALRISGTV